MRIEWEKLDVNLILMTCKIKWVFKNIQIYQRNNKILLDSRLQFFM